MKPHDEKLFNDSFNNKTKLSDNSLPTTDYTPDRSKTFKAPAHRLNAIRIKARNRLQDKLAGTLSIKQKDFCKHYCIDKSGANACIRAGYSPKNAGSQANRLLRDKRILSYIDEILDERVARYTLSKEDYERKTIELHEQTASPNTKLGYWKILGQSKGFVKPENTQSVSIFNDIARQLQDKYETKADKPDIEQPETDVEQIKPVIAQPESDVE